MAVFSKIIITENGQELISRVLSGTGNIKFTSVSASDRVYESSKLLTLKKLESVRQTVPVSSVTKTNEAAVKVEAVFVNNELKEGYRLRTLGLYAEGSDGTEILFAATSETSGNCFMPPFNNVTSSSLIVNLVTAVGNSENASFEVEPAAIASAKELNSLKKRVDGLEDLISGLDTSGISSLNITIPAGGSGGGYIDIHSPGVTEDVIPIVFIAPEDSAAAAKCGLSPRAQTGGGYIRLSLKTAPEREINADVILLSPSKKISSGGESITKLLPATATRLGSVKIGNGISVTDDGTISVTTEGITATDEDVENIIDEIFGEQSN